MDMFFVRAGQRKENRTSVKNDAPISENANPLRYEKVGWTGVNGNNDERFHDCVTSCVLVGILAPTKGIDPTKKTNVCSFQRLSTIPTTALVHIFLPT